MRASPSSLGRIASTPSPPTPKRRSQSARTTAGSSGDGPPAAAAGRPGRRSTTRKSFPRPSTFVNGSAIAYRPSLLGRRRRCSRRGPGGRRARCLHRRRAPSCGAWPASRRAPAAPSLAGFAERSGLAAPFVGLRRHLGPCPQARPSAWAPSASAAGASAGAQAWRRARRRAAAGAVGAADCPALAAAAFSISVFSLSGAPSRPSSPRPSFSSSRCSRFESCWLELCARTSDVSMKMTAVIAVRRVRKLPAPDDAEDVWLPPPPPNAMPMPPPLPACSSTTRIRNTQTKT